jgi:three-Cys-motif partner protein
MARTGEQETVWELKPHTQAKHQIPSGYLAAWFPILSSWNARIVFLDGFAGPGIYEGGQPGSPMLALDVLLNHSHGAKMANKQFVFMFNEAEQDRHDKLSETIESYKPSTSLGRAT